jgi:group I intron endonuclease
MINIQSSIPIIGIYKITSPSGKIYIGQSTNIKKRFKHYKQLYNCKSQIKLYRSLIKYSPENHKFEIIEECTLEQLNERERYFQDYYNTIGKNGLNCKLTKTKDKSGLLSDETLCKMSKSMIGKNIGKKHNIETRLKMSKSAKGKTFSEEHKLKLSKSISKSVIQYNLDGNFIKEWPSLISVYKELKIDLGYVLSGKTKTAGGYKWEYQR